MVIAGALAAGCSKAEEAERLPRLGTEVPDAEIASISLNVLPTGAGLPKGSGNARLGFELYRNHCTSCHGANGKGGPEIALAGRPQRGTDWSTGASWPYATSIFDYVRRAMPPFSPKTFTDDELYSLTAYVLHLNDLVNEDQVLDQETLPKIEMPARAYSKSIWQEEP